MVECQDGLLSFPKSALISKIATGAEGFLLKHPDWDGRGVVIAVLDTGIDPSAGGLQVGCYWSVTCLRRKKRLVSQKTTEGKDKILDIIDATGSGDVDTSCIRRTDADADRKIQSPDGRTLEIPDEWCNPTGTWHVGLKNENELIPDVVRTLTKVCTYIHLLWAFVLRLFTAVVMVKMYMKFYIPVLSRCAL